MSTGTDKVAAATAALAAAEAEVLAENVVIEQHLTSGAMPVLSAMGYPISGIPWTAEQAAARNASTPEEKIAAARAAGNPSIPDLTAQQAADVAYLEGSQPQPYPGYPGDSSYPAAQYAGHSPYQPAPVGVSAEARAADVAAAQIAWNALTPEQQVAAVRAAAAGNHPIPGPTTTDVGRV